MASIKFMSRLHHLIGPSLVGVIIGVTYLLVEPLHRMGYHRDMQLLVVLFLCPLVTTLLVRRQDMIIWGLITNVLLVALSSFGYARGSGLFMRTNLGGFIMILLFASVSGVSATGLVERFRGSPSEEGNYS